MLYTKIFSTAVCLSVCTWMATETISAKLGAGRFSEVLPAKFQPASLSGVFNDDRYVQADPRLLASPFAF